MRQQYIVWHAGPEEWGIEPYDGGDVPYGDDVHDSWGEAKRALLGSLRGTRDAYNSSIRGLRALREKDVADA